MSDVGRGMGSAADEDRLPWLEPVEDEGAEEGVSVVRLLAGLVVALVALGLIVGGVYWIKQRATGGTAPGDPSLITAEKTPYKIRVAEGGGMDVKGQGDSSYAASEGADPDARIDLSKIPEAPIAKSQPAPAPAAPSTPAAEQIAKVPATTPVRTVALPPSRPASAPAEPKKAEPAPAPVLAKKTEPAPKPAAPAKTEAASAPASAPAGGGTIQLGALDSEAKANAAWKSLSGRYTYLAALNHSVVKAEVNGKTYYRLRAAAGGQASSICSKLKVAGEACTVVG